jgi:hypothetical protein
MLAMTHHAVLPSAFLHSVGAPDEQLDGSINSALSRRRWIAEGRIWRHRSVAYRGHGGVGADAHLGGEAVPQAAASRSRNISRFML